jgi:hypothetical protein
MRLECILDTCPKDGKFVNHLKCPRCVHNPLGEDQPEFAWQECNHPKAEHKPDHERWQNMKACGIDALTIMVTRP